ncbi:MAG: 2-oxoglutarate dehydrogenase complex dihydrolipoyllysine-residue succinyltransferase [Solitalea-like symbiont of Tyrophagus putrescentiae]
MAIDVNVPSPGESITEVTVGKWLKHDGEYVELDEPVVELESEKATLEVRAESAGILHPKSQEGDTVAVGAVLFSIDTDSKKPSMHTKSVEATDNKQTSNIASSVKDTTNANHYATNHPSPAAAKILAEKNIDQKDISGSGKGGRITKSDALDFKTNENKNDAASEQNRDINQRSEKREKLSNLRKTIAKRLVAVKNETAMLTTFNEVDMHAVMSLRSKYKDKFKEKYDVNLGFMSFFTKACCEALKLFPAVNARIEDNEIVYSNFIDISIAVSTPKGLVVPVLRNAEKMSFVEIENGIVKLALKARDGKLTMDDMKGGTFTITNGGTFGSMLSTPIINSPQSAILGMHNIVQRPVAINKEVAIRPIMYLALSYDHRIVDGKESVGFLVTVKNLLEDPNRILLGV